MKITCTFIIIHVAHYVKRNKFTNVKPNSKLTGLTENNRLQRSKTAIITLTNKYKKVKGKPAKRQGRKAEGLKRLIRYDSLVADLCECLPFFKSRYLY